MKKVFALILAVAMVLVFAAPVSADATVDLIDGRDGMVAGTVDITDDGADITVTYTLSAEAVAAGWLITETHVDVAILADDLAQNKNGNPKVGKFEWCEELETPADTAVATVAVPDGALAETDVCVAVHAALWNDNELVDDPIDDLEESLWAAGEDFDGSNWAMYVIYTLNPEVV